MNMIPRTKSEFGTKSASGVNGFPSLKLTFSICKTPTPASAPSTDEEATARAGLARDRHDRSHTRALHKGLGLGQDNSITLFFP